MNVFITCLAILFILILIGTILLRRKRKLEIIPYACKQYCELHKFKYYHDSVKPSSLRQYHYQFDYQDTSSQRTGYVMMHRLEVKEVIFDKRSLDPRQNNPMFKSANDINNIIEFPKKR